MQRAATLLAWCRPLALALALAAAAPAALAGRSCDEGTPDAAQAAQSLSLAENTLAVLAPLQDEVVLLARVGQDLSKYKQHYSHMAFAVRQGERWSVVHKLNTCGTDESKLYEQGLMEFFADSLFKYEAGIWRLEPAVQERLKKALLGKKSVDYHEPRYSMLAYPFSTKYQNSNGWVLEVLAWGLAPEDEANTRKSAQAWLQATGYRPTQLELGTMTRLGARVTRANVAFDDHPDNLRWSGHIQTVTVDSVIGFLRTLPNGCLEKGCPTRTAKLLAP